MLSYKLGDSEWDINWGIHYYFVSFFSACNCDPVGAEHGGECQGRTDPAHDLVAGRCICKRYVVGDRCDTCQDGYWNMKSGNPDGCECKEKI